MIILKPYTWIELSKSAFNHNAALYKKLLGKEKYLAIVVKANAYGHGIEEIANLCQKNKNVDWLCTTHLSEGIQLRRQGIGKPILVLSIIDEDPALAFQYNIDLMVYEKSMLDELNRTGEHLGKKAQIHIKIDTGMSRLGFSPTTALDIIAYAKTCNFINVRGLATHCAASGNSDLSFTYKQVNTFTDIEDQAQKIGYDIPLRHAFNSAATTALYSDYPRINFARVGAGVYGFWASDSNKKITQTSLPDFELRPVLTWKTRIMHIKKINAGATVGYDRTFLAKRPTRLAVLPIGYYENYSMKIYNHGQVGVYVKDAYAPVIGRVCMNQTMIDISDHSDVKIGSEVVIIGNKPKISAYSLARYIGSNNPREITTRLHPKIKRIIVD